MNEPAKNKWIIFMAYVHRYAWIVLILLAAAVFREAAELVICGGMIVYGAWTLCGYWRHWDHIYCSWQNSVHRIMTPEKIEWDKMDMKDEIGVSILILVLGAAGLVLL